MIAHEWPRVSLGDLLTLERRPVKVLPDAQYAEIGTYSFGRGIFHKQPRSGLEVGNKDLYLIREGDFILQITFAWEGAVALASAAEDGMYGSVRFPTFRVDETQCYPPFLVSYFKLEEGRRQLVKISPGSAGRNRVLSIKRIPEISVPLPSLAEQQRIVARIETLARRVEEARGLRREAVGEAALFADSATNAVFNDTFFQQWPVFALDDVADIRSGVTLGRTLDGPTIHLPYLRVANVQDGHLNLAHMKEVEILESERDKWQLRSGDILLTEGGDWDKLGRGTVWRGEIPNCIHQNHIFRVRVDAPDFDSDYLSWLIGSPYGKAFFQSASKQTTNLASINQRQLKAFRVAKPPLSEQHRIVAYLDGLQSKVDELRRLQAEAQKELDALMPSVLAKAFAGELVPRP